MTSSFPAVRAADSAEAFRVQEIHYPPDYRQAPHAHDTTGITLVLGGEIRETASRREEEASSLSVVVKPAGTVHADRVGPRGAWTVRVEILDEKALLGDARDLGPWRWLHAGPGVRPLLGLRRALAGDPAGPDPEEAVAELLGEVTDADGPNGHTSPGWVRRAREAIEDRAGEGIRVRDLAAELEVHPVSLTRAFRRAYGVPVSVYRRRVRLRRAAARISATAQRLSRIAHATGYADHAHMSREVRESTGLTPTRLRELSRGA
ncbi:MAG: AraC family transcriptional regulator [Gemmatimonadota bacterium]|nr:AraC family transcriptional regulator [Gemmatimonadota bacterium]